MGWCLLREGADASAFEILLEATHKEDADDGSRDVVDLVGRCVLVIASTETEQGSFHYRASADHKVALDWTALKFIRGISLQDARRRNRTDICHITDDRREAAAGIICGHDKFSPSLVSSPVFSQNGRDQELLSVIGFGFRRVL